MLARISWMLHAGSRRDGVTSDPSHEIQSRGSGVSSTEKHEYARLALTEYV